MKNKLLNRILLIVVPLIWGKYVYDMVVNQQLEEELEQLQTQNDMAYSPVRFNKDSFDLALPDRDPFLNANFKRNQKKVPKTGNGKTSPQRNEAPKEIVPEAFKWPEIQYLGFVKNWNNQEKKPLCMMKVDGRLLKLGVGEVYKEILIESAYRDSLVLRHEKNRLRVKKG